jgi:hypothetical protein
VNALDVNLNESKKLNENEKSTGLYLSFIAVIIDA